MPLPQNQNQNRNQARYQIAEDIKQLSISDSLKSELTTFLNHPSEEINGFARLTRVSANIDFSIICIRVLLV